LENTNCVATCTNTCICKTCGSYRFSKKEEKQRQQEQKDTHDNNKHYFIRKFI